VLAVAGQPLLAVLASGSFALALTVLELLSWPLMAQVSRENERVSLFATSQSLGWLATLVGDLLGGIVPELAGRAAHQASASAGAIRAAFVVIAVLSLAGMPFLVRLARSPSLEPAMAADASPLFRVDIRRFIRILLPTFLLGLGAGMYLTFLQLYLAQRFGLSPGPIGVVLAVGAALTALSTLAVPRISSRFGMVRTIGVSQVSAFPLILLLAFLFVLPVAVVVLYVRQMLINVQSPLYQVFGMTYVQPGQRARLATALLVANGIGSAGIGPAVSGFLQVRGGFQLAFSVAALFYLFAGVSFLWLFGRHHAPVDGGPAVNI
jgi:predicted MFS family arabinose efflux permease